MPPVDDYRQWRGERRFRLRVIVSLLLGLVGMFSLVVSRFIAFGIPFFLFSVVMVALSVIGFLMLYLQTGFRSMSSRDSTYLRDDDTLREIRKRLDRLDFREKDQHSDLIAKLEVLENTIQNVQRASPILSDENRSQLINIIKSQLESESASQVLTAIRARVEEQAEQDSRSKFLNRQFAESLERLQHEIAALSRRGNLNLALGIVTTVIGLTVLGYYVFRAQPSGQDPWLFTSHFLPRLTLVVFIELFAYFFLRLYKSSLTEIKYFQNEMTNLESKFIALTVAEATDKDTRNQVVTELSKTERNHILEKGQTTVELERAKVDKDILSNFVARVLALIGKNNG